ncbi:LacI family DNA-binding transcriptional regulator [Streptomyces sp. 7-21]|uniref:LacI family DNA-binding transcriptional regulator n=1 Tax=Streptomyces sp. 7-21 TaxID=2802283 RepID=UPI00191FBD38|nr:LacI family DNA-binding transcriptional regulator [Streptomyces sp. 7-21]MBL1066383.1 LacI family DNA-binding transcriptional regulator [Streptomyces sp. 7-21]
MSVTLADVAARAGVSAATVSRVLNGNYPVAEATKTRVLRAVEELEYVVNGPASALAAASSDLVGVLVNDIADPFFGIMASAVQSELAPDTPGPGGKLAVVCNTVGSPERELTYLTLLQRQRAAAVVLTGGALEDAGHTAALATRLRRLAASGARVVLCGRPPLPPSQEHDGTPPPLAITFDNRGGARELTAHLIGLGHRRLAYLAGPANRTTTRHRLEGHRQALAEAGLAGDAERLTVFGRYDRASGYEGTLRLLEREPGLTAIVAANDTVALGVCAALRERGLRIPEDVSVTGFDDLPFAADAAPALTTMSLPLAEAGALAARLALGRETPSPTGTHTIRATLTRRASTAPPPPGRS